MSNKDEDRIKLSVTFSSGKNFDYYWDMMEKLNCRERRINYLSWHSSYEDVRVNYRLSKFNYT